MLDGCFVDSEAQCLRTELSSTSHYCVSAGNPKTGIYLSHHSVDYILRVL